MITYGRKRPQTIFKGVEQMRQQVVEGLARTQRVEQIVANICKPCADTASLADLSQMVYLVLLTYDAAKVVDLWERGQMDFFIVRVVLNQYRSKNSPYYHLFREFNARTAAEVTERIGGTTDAEG